MPEAIYKLHLKGALHVGSWGIGREETLSYIPSDTLFGALVVAWAALGFALQPLLKDGPQAPLRLTSVFPFAGPVHFVDVESLRTLRADADAVAAAYRQEIEAFVARCRDACREDRIDFVQVDTSQSFDRVLLAFLRARQSKF